MDRRHAQSLLRSILGSEPSPPVVSRACELETLSRSRVTLKPMEEPARAHACCWLASEQARGKVTPPVPLQLPLGLPIPPAQFRKLLEIFRRELALAPPSTGLDVVLGKSPSRSASNSPRKKRILANPPLANVPSIASPSTSPSRPRRAAAVAARTRAVAIKNDEDGGSERDGDEDAYKDTKDPDDDSDSDQDMSMDLSDTDGSSRRSSVGVPSTSRATTERGLSSNISDKAVESFLSQLPFSAKSKTATLVGFQQYKGLVKDQYGLLAGVAYVVAHRAEVEVAADLEDRIRRSIPGGASQDRLREWIHWAKKIITGQMWIQEIAVRPEPQRAVVGGPGNWFP